MDHKNKTQTNVNMYSDTVLTQAQKTVIEQTTTKTPEINRITNSSNKTTTETIKLKTIKKVNILTVLKTSKPKQINYKLNNVPKISNSSSKKNTTIDPKSNQLDITHLKDKSINFQNDIKNSLVTEAILKKILPHY